MQHISLPALARELSAIAQVDLSENGYGETCQREDTAQGTKHFRGRPRVPGSSEHLMSSQGARRGATLTLSW